MDGLRDATSELRGQLESAQSELGEAERGVSGLSTEKESIQMSIKLVNTRIDTVDKEIIRTQEKLNTLQKEGEEARLKLGQLSNDKKGCDKEVPILQARLLALSREEEALQERYVEYTIVRHIRVTCVYICRVYV